MAALIVALCLLASGVAPHTAPAHADLSAQERRTETLAGYGTYLGAFGKLPASTRLKEQPLPADDASRSRPRLLSPLLAKALPQAEAALGQDSQAFARITFSFPTGSEAREALASDEAEPAAVRLAAAAGAAVAVLSTMASIHMGSPPSTRRRGHRRCCGRSGNTPASSAWSEGRRLGTFGKNPPADA